MRRALCLLRDAVHYRRQAFCEGLQAAGWKLAPKLDDPGPGDCLVIWNRYGGFHEQATQFEKRGALVLVAENAYLPSSVVGKGWYSLAAGHHAGAGSWTDGGPQRWDALGIEPAPWRQGGGETLILGQRGIGEPGVGSPPQWAEKVQRRIGGRVRQHPGKADGLESLDRDLQRAGSVVTWASSAALLALLRGVPVWYDMPKWIGAGASRPMAEFGGEPRRDDAARLAMFRRLAWAMWRLDEIKSGKAFAPYA